MDKHIIMNLIFINLKSNHAFGIAKSINFWYNYYDLFSNEISEKFSFTLIKYFFFRLFLHWSYNVREIFHHLICYRILL